MFKLKIGDIPNQYPFVRKKFEIDVYLIDENSQLRTGEEIPLDVSVVLEEDSNVSSANSSLNTIEANNVLEIVENTGIQKNGAAKVTIFFREVSGSFDNKKFALIFKAIHSTYKILSATSQPMYSIRHKLVVEEENKAPYVWYKDEGGKDKCIEIKVSLRDSENKIIKDRKVPLKCFLLYSNSQRVLQQNILVISPESRAVVDENGNALIKLRINEVSNRHRGQLFQVQISPDTTTAPLTSDIGPAFCMPVDVKSKRNANVKKQTDNSSQSVNKKQKTSGNDLSIYNNSLTHIFPISDTNGAVPSAATIPIDLPYRQFSNSMYQTPNCLNNAVNNIVNWATVIMRGIESIQWREIGFEQNNDRTPNITKPLYNIPNPNYVLTDIVEQYSMNIVDSLKFLQSVSQGEDVKISDPTRIKSLNDTKLSNENDFDNEGIDNVFQMPISGRGVSFGNVDVNIYSTFSPRLGRDVSVNSVIPIIERPQYNRNNSLFLDTAIDQPPLPIPTLNSSTTWGYDAMFEAGSSDESQVVYVVAEQSLLYLGISGLPAYNSNFELVGIYRESQTQEKVTVLRFTSISLILIDDKDLLQAKDKLQDLINEKSPTVFHISKCRNSIDILRENAMIYFYELLQYQNEIDDSNSDNNSNA